MRRGGLRGSRGEGRGERSERGKEKRGWGRMGAAGEDCVKFGRFLGGERRQVRGALP